MQKSVINRLNQLNQRFYEAVAVDFSKSRNQAWSGWGEVLTKIKKSGNLINLNQEIRVLDVGCGNGRWAEFLAANQLSFSYLGLDSSQKLLNLALQKAVFLKNPLKLQLRQADLVDELLGSRIGDSPASSLPHGFDLAVAFGFLHHLPSGVLRRKFIKYLSNQIKPGGWVVITAWRFDRDENLLKRQVDPATQGFSHSELENGDYLLDWQRGSTAIRYCHLTKPAEMKELLVDSCLALVDTFAADGKSNNLNDYYLCKRENWSTLTL